MRRDQKLALAGLICLIIATVLGVLALTACGPNNSPTNGGYAQRIAGPTVTGHAGPTVTATLPGCLYGPQGQADRRCTPGAINPEVTQANLATTICAPSPPKGQKSWIQQQRPPTGYTNTQKTIGLMRYGQPQQPKNYEEDHLIPLELGGAPRNPDNLWPEPWAEPNGAGTKDHKAENVLHAAVCSAPTAPGHMELAAAQQTIQLEWTH